MRAALTRRLKSELLTIEIATQVSAFVMAFGRLPDFLDGHQHVHLLPQVRDAFLKVVAETAPNAWVRQCGRARGARRLRDRKALVLDVLSLGFRSKAQHLGIASIRPSPALSFQPKATTPRFSRAFSMACRTAA